jgi:Tol biopolymer transport system component
MRDGSVFLYGIHRNDRYELMAADPEGTPRLLWSFPTEEFAGPLEGDPPPEVAVHGTRIAFALNQGDEASLYLAQAGEDRARRLLTLPGLLSPRGHGPSMWSPDGRKLAIRYVPPPPAQRGVLVVEVGNTGEVVGEPLMLEGGGIGQWMPDSQHFLGGGNWSGEDQWGAGVWLVSLDPNEEPVLVSAGLQESIWYFRLSPDGQYITFEGEVPRGSSVWRVDLGDTISREDQGG